MTDCEIGTPLNVAVTLAERVAKNTSNGMTVAKIQTAQKNSAHSDFRRKRAVSPRTGRKRQKREMAETTIRRPHPTVKTEPTSKMSKGEEINLRQYHE